MNLLFVCTTEFQLLTALNMKYHIYKDDIADIIVDNYHGEEKKLADRISQTKLFRHVCFVNSYIEQKTLHAYMRGISDGKENVTLGTAFRNSGLFIWSRIKTLFSGDKGWLNVLVDGVNKLSFSEYDSFLGYGGKPITQYVRKYLANINPHCHVVQFDEGVGSYWTRNVGENNEISRCEVYEPQLIQFKIDSKQIPTIKRDDAEFISIVNQVFEYDNTKCIDFKDSIIFFDQGTTSPMPKYLRNASFLKKTIFRNSYRRHKEEEDEYKKWKQCTIEILKTVSDKRIWIKPHPRSIESALTMFKDIPNVEILPQYQAPWEIIALNSIVDNAVFMTFASSSVCLYNSVVELPGNNKSVLLYDMIDLPIHERFIQYCKALTQLFPNKIFIPRDKNELLSILETK